MRFFTRFVFLPSFSLAALAALSACGHNAIQYSDGIGVNAGFDPEHLTALETQDKTKTNTVANVLNIVAWLIAMGFSAYTAFIK